MKLTKLMAFGVAVVAVAGLVANASVVTSWTQVQHGKDVTGTLYNVWQMHSVTSTDWTNARLDVALTSGSMYNDSMGGTAVPNPAFFTVFPTLEWDTYADIPGGYPAGSVGFAGATVMNATTVGASWFDTANTGAGDNMVFQLTLSQNANGTMTGKSYDVQTQGVGVPFEFPIVNGMVVPEPATLTLLGMGALALIRRRRA